MQLLTHYNIKQFSPSGLFCNAAADGSKPVKMQRTENKRKKGDFMKYYILTENRHKQILLFDSFKDAFNWCKYATRWTDAEIKANIKTASKIGSHYSIFA